MCSFFIEIYHFEGFFDLHRDLNISPHSSILIWYFIFPSFQICGQLKTRVKLLPVTESYHSEPSHEKTNNFHMRKQNRRSAVQLQRPCFRHTVMYNSSSTYIQSFRLLALFCNCTAWFVSDLVGNPNCWFSHAQAHRNPRSFDHNSRGVLSTLPSFIIESGIFKYVTCQFLFSHRFTFIIFCSL